MRRGNFLRSLAALPFVGKAASLLTRDEAPGSVVLDGDPHTIVGWAPGDWTVSHGRATDTVDVGDAVSLSNGTLVTFTYQPPA